MWFNVCKAFHLIFIIAWFSGLFYLPRLFVYHAMSDDQISQNRFKIMESRLYYFIMYPAMLLSVLFGVLLILQKPVLLDYSWFQCKLFLTATLIIYHVYCGYLLKQFKGDRNTRRALFYRLLNEYPTVILVAVVLLVMLHSG